MLQTFALCAKYAQTSRHISTVASSCLATLQRSSLSRFLYEAQETICIFSQEKLKLITNTGLEKCARFTLHFKNSLTRVNHLTPELNPSAQRCLARLYWGLLLEPRISLIYAWKTNKYNNYSFSLLIIYGSSYMFRHYIAILRERS
jgi:hypothetical protein